MAAPRAEAELALKELPILRPGLVATSPMQMGADGEFYGVVAANSPDESSFGFVYQASKNGRIRRLKEFLKAAAVPKFPGSATIPGPSFVLGKDGTMYGIVERGGEFRHGSIFSLTPTGVYEELYQFTEASFYYRLHFVDDDGTIFASHTDESGSPSSIFTLSPEGTFAELLTLPALGELSGTRYRAEILTLLRAQDGAIYGFAAPGGRQTSETETLHYYVFRCEENGAVTILSRFLQRGLNYGGMIEESDGSFIVFGPGYSSVAGNSQGTASFYRVSKAGQTTLLNSAGWDFKTLARGSDGNFYGAVPTGAPNGGIILQLDGSGKFSIRRKLELFLAPGSTQVADGGDGKLYTLSAFHPNRSFRKDLTRIPVTPPSDETMLNAPPIAGADIYTKPVLPRMLPVLANDHDPKREPLRITKVGEARHGNVTISPDERHLRYTPNTEGTTDSFTYTITDGKNEATGHVLLRRPTAGLYKAELKTERTSLGTVHFKFGSRGNYVATWNKHGVIYRFRGDLNLKDASVASFYVGDTDTAVMRFKAPAKGLRRLQGSFEFGGQSIPFTATFEISF